jgi:hypothetical protein
MRTYERVTVDTNRASARNVRKMLRNQRAFMKYAVVAIAWLTAWGVLSPQGADAGFVPSFDDSMSAGAPLSSAENSDLGSVTSDQQPEAPTVQNPLFGVVEAPCGAPAPRSGHRLTPTGSTAAAMIDCESQLGKSPLTSRLPAEFVFTPLMLQRSSVFRPPRA